MEILTNKIIIVKAGRLSTWKVTILFHCCKGLKTWTVKSQIRSFLSSKAHTGSPAHLEWKPESQQWLVEALSLWVLSSPYSPPTSTALQSFCLSACTHSRCTPASGPFHCCDLSLKFFSPGYPPGALPFPISNLGLKATFTMEPLLVWFVHGSIPSAWNSTWCREAGQ